MGRPIATIPPFSPVLVLGLALRPVPPAWIRPALSHAMEVMHRRHPDLFERLAAVDACVFIIDPTDLPFAFRLDLRSVPPRLDVHPGMEADRGIQEASATIRGPLLTLIDLLEGRIDGDGLFFSRDLSVGGDTGAVVALRNAVDAAEVDLVADFASVFGPLSGPADRVIRAVRHAADRFVDDVETLRTAAIAPAMARADAQSADMRALGEAFEELRRKRPRRARSTGT